MGRCWLSVVVGCLVVLAVAVGVVAVVVVVVVVAVAASVVVGGVVVAVVWVSVSVCVCVCVLVNARHVHAHANIYLSVRIRLFVLLAHRRTNFEMQTGHCEGLCRCRYNCVITYRPMNYMLYVEYLYAHADVYMCIRICMNTYVHAYVGSHWICVLCACTRECRCTDMDGFMTGCI